MRQSAKEKIVVLAVGAGRTVVLACVVLALLAVAVRQTVLENGKKK